MAFDYAVAGDFFQIFKGEVNAISWHGYYEEKSGSKLLIPVVHFKKRSGCKEVLRHYGAVNIEECIPFPVCSVYLSSGIDISHLGSSNISRRTNLVIDVDEYLTAGNVRFDFFVFPKDFHFDNFKKSVARVIFEGQSIDVFNNGGCLSHPEGGLNIAYHELKDGECVLIRYVSEPSDMYSCIGGNYSIVIHEPNDVYNILNRLVVTEGECGELNPPEIMRDLHEKSIRG